MAESLVEEIKEDSISVAGSIIDDNISETETIIDNTTTPVDDGEFKTDFSENFIKNLEKEFEENFDIISVNSSNRNF